MRRRALLSALGAAATAGLAGCLDGHGPSGVPVPETNVTPDSTRPESRRPGSDATDATTTDSGASGTTTGKPASEFVRCRGDPVSAERSVTDEPGYEDDDMEYFPENETVRYVAARSRGEPAKYSTIAFDDWASLECAEAAAVRTREVTADRLGTDEFGSAIGRPPEFADGDDSVVRLSLETRVEDGETVSTPTVSRDQLADAAPRSVEATVSLADEEFSRTVPVFAHHVEIGLA
jgi:hypothetical protein